MEKEFEKMLQREVFKFGFLPMLVVLERMEDLNDFETCEAIFNMLNKHNQEFNPENPIPTRFSELSVIEYRLEFMTKFGLSGDVAVGNCEYYADEICFEIQKFKRFNRKKKV